ncbi:hypothetical protein ZIOFF_011810 [Zingiber officinale]|uniref:Pectin acetylesterase n=1 Tax=Zingiber officinale TaxID=94328 RepID=A0A8J5HMV7_ZINOF|nr:hypothetical protein ZIOFF_011810 [Zingiber officinale]
MAHEVRKILEPDIADPNGAWTYCKSDITKCSPTQLEVLQEYRLNFLTALKVGLHGLRSVGMFINSCFIHTQLDPVDVFH